MQENREQLQKEALLRMIVHAADCHYHKDSNGEYYITPYLSYDDYLSDETIREILAANHPRDLFYEKIFDAYLDYTDTSSRAILLADLKSSDEYHLLEDVSDYDLETQLDDYISEHVYTNIPYEHYLRQEIQLNIVIDTGDLNTDFTENNLLNYYAPEYSDLEEGEELVSESSSLLWLCRSQGLSKTELEEAIQNGTAYKGEVLDAVQKKKELDSELEKLGKHPYGSRYYQSPYNRYLTQRDTLAGLERKYKQLNNTYQANSITFPEYQNLVKKKNLPMSISCESDFLAQQKQILKNLKERMDAVYTEMQQLEKSDSEVERVKQLTEALTVHMKEVYHPLSKTNTFQNMQFLESVLQESRNSTTHMNALTFCVKMPLEKAINIQEIINKEKEHNKSYDATERCGNSFFILDKEVCCGLYDAWNGAGGLFEIQLKNDIELPLKYIHSMNIDGAIGYSLKSIYGMGDETWKDCVKEVVELEPGMKQNRKNAIPIPLEKRISMIETIQIEQAKGEGRGKTSQER